MLKFVNIDIKIALSLKVNKLHAHFIDLNRRNKIKIFNFPMFGNKILKW